MNYDSDEEKDAFLSFLATFPLSRPVMTVEDLSDGVALFEALQVVDPSYFKLPARSSTQQSVDNWVLRLNTLKRLYRLITQYFADVLHQPTATLQVPDLHAMAKDSNMIATLDMCRLAIAITVHSERNAEIIAKIQELSESRQRCLKRAIEQVMAKLAPVRGQNSSESTMTDDDHYYEIQSDRRRILAEKETVEKVYTTLLDEHRTLQIALDDALAEKDDALARLRESTRALDDKRNDRTDALMRAEIDRLRVDLQKSEENLHVAETDLERHQAMVFDLRKTVDELQTKADEAVRLKDKVDEYRHAADKLQKTENVMEKYKKKLEESADLRRRLKALEDQNASLVNKNAALEEDYRRVSIQKPLLDSYKSQLSELEDKVAERNKEIDTLRFEVEQAHAKVRFVEEERAKEAEALELYQERVKELELLTSTRTAKPSKNKPEGDTAQSDNAPSDDRLSDGNDDAESEYNYDDDPTSHGLGGELDDAITGTTMTDLKLQIRQLKRDLDMARTNSAEASRILVLENLLEDANRMKARYETEYLAEHREKLVLQRNLDDIRSGKALGDGAEAAIALRQRLNETVEQLDAASKKCNQLEVQCEGQAKELMIAKSDLTLVNKDQLEILTSLRESVNEEKAGMETDLKKIQEQLKEAQEKERMHMEQLNALLMDKLSLQNGKSIGDINSKDVPEDIRGRFLALSDENAQVKEKLKSTQEKLSKARAFIKSQHKLFNDEFSRSNATSPAMFEEAESSYKSRIKVLEEDTERLMRTIQEQAIRYQKEFDLMTSAVHALGMERIRTRQGRVPQPRKAETSSWLSHQRVEHSMPMIRAAS